MHAAARARRARAPAFVDPAGYARRRPETTLLYQLVEQHYPAFRKLRAAAGRALPERPLRQWVLPLPMALRFLLATRATGHTGAVTLIQRFGSALNLNVHLHMIFIDGVYLTGGVGPPVFRPVPAPGTAELQALVQQIAERMGRQLEKCSLIERDCENAWLSGDAEQAGSLDDLIGHSITYRIAVGPRASQKVFTLQTVPAPGRGLSVSL